MKSVWVLTVSYGDGGCPYCDVSVYDTKEEAFKAKVDFVMEKFIECLDADGVPTKELEGDNPPSFPACAMKYVKNEGGKWKTTKSVVSEFDLGLMLLYAAYHEGDYLFEVQLREREVISSRKKAKLTKQ